MALTCPSCQSLQVASRASVKQLGLPVFTCETCGVQFTSDRKTIAREAASMDEPTQRSLFEP